MLLLHDLKNVWHDSWPNDIGPRYEGLPGFRQRNMLLQGMEVTIWTLLGQLGSSQNLTPLFLQSSLSLKFLGKPVFLSGLQDWSPFPSLLNRLHSLPLALSVEDYEACCYCSNATWKFLFFFGISRSCTFKRRNEALAMWKPVHKIWKVSSPPGSIPTF